MGYKVAASPPMRRIFAIFEPTILPYAIPGALVRIACIEVTSSGVEVPKPTSVRPITSGEIPRRDAT
jgi:hypothetical protein